ncbi:MAG TPA: CRISPR-associated protein Cas4, partial [Bacteroidales bacterium]|nr:CRISPR-associated protein Cas4 [Bacteroidales bacterium]
MISDSDAGWELKRLQITGAMVSYYFICRRKLWLFAKGLNLENISGNADVIKGKILHEGRFKREHNREVSFDTVKIDFLKFGDEIFVHEIKKSKKFEKAHIWQLKYYIYTIKRKGLNCSSGVIHYPSSMRKVEVIFGQEDYAWVEQARVNIDKVIQKLRPPERLNKKMCSRCAYFDFCY